jgi:glycosyltransferase involved in cell wall biosynthesis
MDGLTFQKKILYISYDGLTDPLGQSQILPYLTGLSKKGLQFVILSFEKPGCFSRDRKTIEKICSDAGILWEPMTFHTKPPLLSKVYDRILMKQKAIALYRKHAFDMVHCRSYPSAEVGLFLKEKFGIRFLFDMRGFWPDEKVDSGHWDRSKPWYNWMYRYYKKLEERFLTAADQIISLTNAGKNELLKQYANTPDLAEKITVIPCCADLAHFDFHKISYQSIVELKKKLEIKDEQKVLTYSGSLGTWYMMDEMLDFFKQFQKWYPQSIFLCLTKEPKHIMDEYVKEKCIDPASVITLYSTREELPLYLSLSDYSLFFIRSTYSKISSSPTKHGELMGLGIPVICNDLGDTGTIVNATDSGIVIRAFSADDYVKALDTLDKKPTDKERIRASAFCYFDLEKGVEKYYHIYEDIFAGTKIKKAS